MNIGFHFKIRPGHIKASSLFLCGLVIILILGLPLFYLFTSSFKPDTEVYIIPPRFFPNVWTLKGSDLLLEMTNILTAFRNSFLVSNISSLVAIILSVGVCYTLTRFRIPGMRIFTILSLIVYFLPSILVVLPMYSFWHSVGVPSGLGPLSITYVSFTLPFAIWMMRSYFAGIPIELEEAALVDGCNRVKAFVVIVLPLAIPGIIATYIFTFILSWNELLFARVFSQSLNTHTISVLLGVLLSEATGWHSWAMVNAAGVIATLPVLFLFIFIQRQLVSGFTAGAIKG